jgi:predicted amidophosphoribosyltransferase
MSSSPLGACPDCGHSVSSLAETCPSCARPLRKPAPREGLFLRTLNQLVALSFWVPVIVLIVVFLAVLAGYLSTRW